MLLNLLFLFACGDEPKDTDEPTVVDADNDGYGEDWDCDDNDANVFPSNTETCDGIDNNCDGYIDEDLTVLYYADDDGDGFGDGTSYQESCDPVDGFVENADDCDDEDSEINPDADELCDDVDHNCDESTTDGATDAPTWYYDADMDGYGSDADAKIECDMPEGYVDNMADCDDTNSSSYPEAPELCDTEDNDCDTDVDEDATDTTTYYQDLDGDGFGDDAVTESSCTMPEGFVDVGGDCDDNNVNAYDSTAVETCDGFDNNCDGDADEGVTTTYYADSDNDTYGDPDSSIEACEAPLGYVEDMTDCDDSSNANNTDGTEVCDGVDNNCDEDVDEGVTTTYYADADGDTYGDPDVTMEACEAPENYVLDMTDCDDDNEFANDTSAEEVCDGVDNNCNEDVDEGVTTTYYADADGDTYGDPDVTMEACEAPENYVLDMTDCDDEDIEINPGADEIPGDTFDNDCVDGDASGTDVDGDEVDTSIDCDDNDVNVGAATTMFYADTDGDTYGDADSSQAFCTEEDATAAGFVADMTDCDDSNELAYDSSAEEVCDGADNNCDGGGEGGANLVDEGVVGDVYTDADGDGFGDDSTVQSLCLADIAADQVEQGGDCNDVSEDDDGDTVADGFPINPDATEIAGDGIDQDCTGTETCYEDADGDGYGSLTTTESEDLTCGSSGVSEVSTDCDDDNEHANDNTATELCDGFDNNCNGDVDEGTESEQVMMYMDTDGDCYGDNASGQMMCPMATTAVVCDPADPSTVPEYTSDNTDCNDTDATINPNATENPNEGDKDCDGIETGDLSVTDLQVGDLQITEIMVNPSTPTDRDGEWFEVYVSNTISGTLQLNGLVLSNLTNISSETPIVELEILSENLLVSAGDYITFAAKEDSSINGGLLPDTTFNLTLNNTGEIVGLWSEEGATTAIDSLDVDGSGSTSEGVALAKDEQDAWCAAIESYGDGDLGTPGAMNYSCLEYSADCDDGVDNDGDGDVDCDDSDCSTESACTVQPLSYASDVASIFGGCTGCHGGSGGFSLSYANMVDTPSNGVPSLDRIEPNDPSASYLWHKINGTHSSVGGSGGKMGNISASNLTIIEQWINDGANP